MGKKIAVLAVQGAFIEHERALSKLGCECVELRQGPDVRQPFDALVLPGGESTVQAKLLRELGMIDELHRRIADGIPVMGTCAGLIPPQATLPRKWSGEPSRQELSARCP